MPTTEHHKAGHEPDYDGTSRVAVGSAVQHLPPVSLDFLRRLFLSMVDLRPGPMVVKAGLRAAACGGRPRAGNDAMGTGEPASPSHQVGQQTDSRTRRLQIIPTG